eukprot:10261173-Alexandrium_andersonii.AAC.1
MGGRKLESGESRVPTTPKQPRQDWSAQPPPPRAQPACQPGPQHAGAGAEAPQPPPQPPRRRPHQPVSYTHLRAHETSAHL